MTTAGRCRAGTSRPSLPQGRQYTRRLIQSPPAPRWVRLPTCCTARPRTRTHAPDRAARNIHSLPRRTKPGSTLPAAPEMVYARVVKAEVCRHINARFQGAQNRRRGWNWLADVANWVTVQRHYPLAAGESFCCCGTHSQNASEQCAAARLPGHCMRSTSGVPTAFHPRLIPCCAHLDLLGSAHVRSWARLMGHIVACRRPKDSQARQRHWGAIKARLSWGTI